MCVAYIARFGPFSARNTTSASIHEALQIDIQLSAVPSSLPYSFTKSLADHPGHDGTGASKLHRKLEIEQKQLHQ
jgi:hypothetical protein